LLKKAVGEFWEKRKRSIVGAADSHFPRHFRRIKARGTHEFADCLLQQAPNITISFLPLAEDRFLQRV